MLTAQFRQEEVASGAAFDVVRMTREAKLEFKVLRFDRRGVLVSVAVFIRNERRRADEGDSPLLAKGKGLPKTKP